MYIVYIYIYTCIHLHTYTFICIHIYIRVYMYTSTWKCVNICMHVYVECYGISSCIYIYMYVFTYMYVYICIHVYICRTLDVTYAAHMCISTWICIYQCMRHTGIYPRDYVYTTYAARRYISSWICIYPCMRHAGIHPREYAYIHVFTGTYKYPCIHVNIYISICNHLSRVFSRISAVTPESDIRGTHVYIHVNMCISMYLHEHDISTWTCIYSCIYMNMYISTWICIYPCIHVNMYMWMYSHLSRRVSRISAVNPESDMCGTHVYIHVNTYISMYTHLSDLPAESLLWILMLYQKKIKNSGKHEYVCMYVCTSVWLCGSVHVFILLWRKSLEVLQCVAMWCCSVMQCVFRKELVSFHACTYAYTYKQIQTGIIHTCIYNHRIFREQMGRCESYQTHSHEYTYMQIYMQTCMYNLRMFRE